MPVAGTIRNPWWQFAAVDVLEILIWATSFELLGFVFAGQLEGAAVYARRISAFLLAAMITPTQPAVLVRKRAITILLFLLLGLRHAWQYRCIAPMV
jgi:membrane protein DedA with SNARE-associated domain